MPITVRLLGTALTAATLSAGGNQIATLSASAGTSTFTITTFPSDPYVGENVHFRLEGAGGHTVTAGRELQDIGVYTDPNEDGSFRYVSNAFRSIPGRVGSHVYKTAGAKVLDHSSYTFGSGLLTQSTNVTVVDPDTYSWDHTYWIDMSASPSTSGMAANDATNTQITTATAFNALRQTYAADSRIRFRFRSGVTHVHTATSSHRSGGAEVLYFDTFGGSAQAIHDCTAGVGDMFAMEEPDSRFIWINQDAIGPYDPQEGTGAQRNFMSNWDADSFRVTFSIYNCDFRGWRGAISGGGSDMKFYNIGVFDTSITDWHNYGIFAGGTNLVSLQGVVVAQSPYAGTSDGKAGEPLDWPDHGPIRIPFYRFMGIARSRLISANGWSTAFGIYIWQPCIRAYVEDHSTRDSAASIGIVIDNELQGGFAVEYGRQNDLSDISYASHLLVDANLIQFTQQRGTVIAAELGGTWAQNNVIYANNLNHDSTFNHVILRQSGRYGGSGVVNNAAWQNPSGVRNNTYISHRSNGEVLASVLNATVTNSAVDGDAEGATIEVSHNQLSGDGHTNSGSLIAASAFSLGGNARSITSGAADSPQTTGTPHDFGLIQRSNPTNAGAHHATGSNVAASIPANTVAPVIKVSVDRTNTLLLDDVGTWTNVDTSFPWTFEGTRFEILWQRNGSNVGSSLNYYREHEHGGTAGTYTAIITYAALDGTRVSATSNSIVVS